MAKFNAGLVVERLEFDFTDFAGPEDHGFVTEPSTGQVNKFFKSIKDTMREVNRMRGAAEQMDDLDLENMSEEETAAAMASIEESSEGAEALQRQTVENLAILCGARRVVRDPQGNEIEDAPLDEIPEGFTVTIEGGSPNFQQLDRLPYRVLQAFTQWLVDEIRPKGQRSGGQRREPQDHRRSTT